MAIGYACIGLGIFGAKLKTCTLKNANKENLIQLIGHNLDVLDKLLHYNAENNVKLFRISSDIIPFASHRANSLEWWNIFSDKLEAMGNFAKNNNIRLSMHPGQYTVLNSPKIDVVERAIDDLSYHCRFLDALKLGANSKIVLHIGGVYGNKTAAVQRFISVYQQLAPNIKSRLVIENDDRQYNIADVFEIGKSQGIPVVFDNLHHQINPCEKKTQQEWLQAVSATWGKEDGPQKIHYSQQEKGKRPGSHSATINPEIFLQFYSKLQVPLPDIMLEVKDKNLSAVKCIACTGSFKIAHLEKEWELYKYLVLEHSPQNYQKIRELLKDKKAYPALAFYQLVDSALKTPATAGNTVNAAQHVWGYFKDQVNEQEHKIFKSNVAKVMAGKSSISLKKQLWGLTLLFKQQYLAKSFYWLVPYVI